MVWKADKKAFESFRTHLKKRHTSSATDTTYLKRLRLSSERSDIPLVEMNKSQLMSLAEKLKNEYNLKTTTINSYISAWRMFFAHLGRNWSGDIQYFQDTGRTNVNSDPIYTDEEVCRILEAAGSRKKAVVALLLDTGRTTTDLHGVTLQDTENLFSEPKTTTDPAGLVLSSKYSTRIVPVTWSRTHLYNYLETEHPRPTCDEAALIHRQAGFEEEETGALSSSRMREIIQDAMAAADIPKDRRHTRSLRHTMTTRWLKAGFSNDVVKMRLGRKPTSSFHVYSHREQQHQHLSRCIDRLATNSTTDCSVCGTTTESNSVFCSWCGSPLG